MMKWFERLLSRSRESRPATTADAIVPVMDQDESARDRETCKAEGNSWLAQGRLAEAERCYRDAIAAEPGFAPSYVNLGFVLAESGRQAEAAEILGNGLALNPNMEDAWFLLGTLSVARGDIDGAIGHFQRAIDIRPDFPEAWGSLGDRFRQIGQLAQALDAYRRRIQCQVESASAHSDLLFTLLYDPDESRQRMFEESRYFGELFDRPGTRLWKPKKGEDDTARRLRIGYLSPDFRSHTVAYLLLPFLVHHDRSRFEIFAYYVLDQVDSVTDRYARLVDQFIPCGALSDEEIADRISKDGIDILVDLAGHTGGNRLPVFTFKPVPVQMTWLGNPATTGLTSIDYRITDIYQDPPGKTEHLHTEKLIRLSRGFGLEANSDYPPVNGLPALSGKSFTFACLTNTLKVNDRAIVLWARILRRLPGSRLILGDIVSSRSGDRVKMGFAAEGIDEGRLILQPRLDFSNFLALHGEIDLALDTFPFCGLATSLHALYMGVPVVTLAGNTAAARQGVSVMETAGLPQFVVATEEEYVGTACYWAENLIALEEIRQGLRARMENTTAGNEALCRELEQAYRTVWEAWVRSRQSEE